ncbi:MAG: hypothetical protein HQK51_00560 [Oligoflexia bacterium]|nr:hypothetical protein [Oligoflexia bacterium]
MATMKNWLIRTRSNQILGPVSKTKIKELLSNQAMGPNDEISSGNGYWFFIKEKDLIQKYVFEDNIQSFNPISEAKDVISIANVTPTPSTPLSSSSFSSKEEVILPSQDDLEYPDMMDNVSPPPSIMPDDNNDNDSDNDSDNDNNRSSEQCENNDITLTTSLDKLKEIASLKAKVEEKKEDNANNSYRTTPSIPLKKRDDRFLKILLALFIILLVSAIFSGIKILKMHLK